MSQSENVSFANHLLRSKGGISLLSLLLKGNWLSLDSQDYRLYIFDFCEVISTHLDRMTISLGGTGCANPMCTRIHKRSFDALKGFDIV